MELLGQACPNGQSKLRADDGLFGSNPPRMGTSRLPITKIPSRHFLLSAGQPETRIQAPIDVAFSDSWDQFRQPHPLERLADLFKRRVCRTSVAFDAKAKAAAKLSA